MKGLFKTYETFMEGNKDLMTPDGESNYIKEVKKLRGLGFEKYGEKKKMSTFGIFFDTNSEMEDFRKHSVNLLSNFEPEYLFTVANGIFYIFNDGNQPLCNSVKKLCPNFRIAGFEKKSVVQFAKSLGKIPQTPKISQKSVSLAHGTETKYTSQENGLFSLFKVIMSPEYRDIQTSEQFYNAINKSKREDRHYLMVFYLSNLEIVKAYYDKKQSVDDDENTSRGIKNQVDMKKKAMKFVYSPKKKKKKKEQKITDKSDYKIKNRSDSNSSGFRESRSNE